MPATKRPTPQDAATARRILLDGLSRDGEVAELVGELTPLHPRNDTFPGEVFLHVAADALDWCGASRAHPLALEGMRERFLPEANGKAASTLTPGHRSEAARRTHHSGEPLPSADSGRLNVVGAFWASVRRSIR